MGTDRRSFVASLLGSSALFSARRLGLSKSTFRGGAERVRWVQDRVGKAASDGRKVCRIPSAWLPYDVSQVSLPSGLRLARQNGPPDVYDVQAYGADPAGKKDSSCAFQAALDSTPDAGGIVFVPPGDYRIDETVVWPTVSSAPDKLVPSTVEGQNRSAVKGVAGRWSASTSSIRYTGGGPLFDLRGGRQEPLHFLGSIRRVALHGEGGKGTAAIDAHHVRSAQFRTLVARRFDTNVIVRGESYYSVWANCLFSDAITDGLSLRDDVNGTTLDRIRCSSNGRYGLDVRLGGFPVNVEGSWFEWNGEAGIGARDTIQVRIAGCYFEGNQGASVAYDGYPGEDYHGALSCRDSYFRPASGAVCFDLGDRPVSVRLDGNTFDATNDIPLIIRTPEFVAHSLVVTSNSRAAEIRPPLLGVDPSGFQDVVALGDEAAAEDPKLGSSNVVRGRQPLRLMDSPLEIPSISTEDRPPARRPGRMLFNSGEGELNLDTGRRWIRPGRDSQ